jgi:hypothetical protein
LIIEFSGELQVLKIFETGVGINEAALDKLKWWSLQIQNRTIDTELFNLSQNLAANFDDISEVLEFYKYKLNICQRISIRNAEKFIQVLKSNMTVINSLEEGDIVSFKRSYYHHAALLTGCISVHH